MRVSAANQLYWRAFGKSAEFTHYQEQTLTVDEKVDLILEAIENDTPLPEVEYEQDKLF